MNWLKVIIEFLKLEPEIQDIITKIVGAVRAAPPEHQSGIKAAIDAAAKKLG